MGNMTNIPSANINCSVVGNVRESGGQSREKLNVKYDARDRIFEFYNNLKVAPDTYN